MSLTGKKCFSLSSPHPHSGHTLMTPLCPATRSSTALQEWDEFSRFNKNRAEAEMKEAADLREAIALTIAEVTGHSPDPALPWLMGGPRMPSSL